MSNRIVHFEIMGCDAGESQKFYADMFGWKLGEPAPELGNYAMADIQPPASAAVSAARAPVVVCGRRFTSTCRMFRRRSIGRRNSAARLRHRR